MKKGSKDLKTLEERQKADNNIMTFLRDHRSGAFLANLADEIEALTLACVETEKSGKITITLNIRPAGGDGAMDVTDTIVSKLPKLTKGGSIFFASPNGALTRQDPRQGSMTLTVLHSDAAPIKLKETSEAIRHLED